MRKLKKRLPNALQCGAYAVGIIPLLFRFVQTVQQIQQLSYSRPIRQPTSLIGFAALREEDLSRVAFRLVHDGVIVAWN